MQMLPMLKNVGQNVMLLYLLPLIRFQIIVVLRQWSLAPRSRGTAMHMVAMVTKLCKALTRISNRQLPTPLPTTAAKQVLTKASGLLDLIICRMH